MVTGRQLPQAAACGVFLLLAACQSMPAPVACLPCPACTAPAGAAAPAAGAAALGPGRAAALAPAPAAGGPSDAAPAATPPSPGEAGAAPALHIALALGGGAARGFAHVGVIKALLAHGVHPDIVVGTSVGSFVAALYAAGYDAEQLQQVAHQFEESSIKDWALPSRGVLKGTALQDFINRKVEGRAIEDLPRKLAIVATDLQSGDMMVFERGNVGLAVRASSSVPGLFRPVAIGTHEYVDGGLVSPVPVRVARRLGADVVIAVDISERPADQSTAGELDIVLQTFAIMGRVIAREELDSADIVLTPELSGVGSTDFSAREAAIRSGERAVEGELPRISAFLQQAQQKAARNAAVIANPPANP